MSWLSTLGNDVKKVFTWLGSPKGQAVVGTAEGVVEAVDPALDGVISIANNWLREIYTAQALATAAAAGGTGGAQKSALVLNALTPQILAFAETQKLPIPTAIDIQNANNALVAFLNALGAGSTTTATLPAGTSTTNATDTAVVKTATETGGLL
jgi:hypothetical protein